LVSEIPNHPNYCSFQATKSIKAKSFNSLGELVSFLLQRIQNQVIINDEQFQDSFQRFINQSLVGNQTPTPSHPIANKKGK